jgi:Holliday junction resolvase RusA-like endonuclease
MKDFAVRIEVPGVPVPKGRPRFGRGRVYTPAKTKAYETVVALKAKEAMKGQHPVDCAVGVSVMAYMPAPKKGSPGMHVSKPDLDNLVKAALDSVRGIVFADDSQIISLIAFKSYDPDPRLVLFVKSAA